MRPPRPTEPARFADLADASVRVASTRARLQKKNFLVDALSRVPPEEIAAAVGWLAGEPICGPIGVGPMQLWAMKDAPAAERVELSLREVEAELEAVKTGPREDAIPRVAALHARMTPSERTFFVGALTGSLRQGGLAGIMLLALTELSGLQEVSVRRAVMVTGSIARAAEALLGPNPTDEPPSALTLFNPVAPMLAQPAEAITEALEGMQDALVEWKIDGVRAQIHKDGAKVVVYSRNGNDITKGVAPLVDSLARLNADRCVLDGEVVLVGPDGRARPFQDTFSGVASAEAGEGDRLKIWLFDCVHKDGVDLLDEPLAKRLDVLASIAPPEMLIPSVRTTDAAAAERFYEEAKAGGHEGVMVKDLSSPYRFGARGRAWQKVKPFTTVDLVILAVEWGGGRRTGYLSNLHLGALREDGSFCMIGKTFKGLTDEMLAFQTKRLQELAIDPDKKEKYVVHVRPELVVEIRFNDVQRSPRYPGGIALRFSRVVRYREDKKPTEIEPLAALVARLPEAATRKQPPPRATRKRIKKRAEQLSLFGEDE
jgi:DNA ligase-1